MTARALLAKGVKMCSKYMCNKGYSKIKHLMLPEVGHKISFFNQLLL